MGIAQRARDLIGSTRSIWNNGDEEDFEREAADDSAYYAAERAPRNGRDDRDARDERSEPPRYESEPPSRGGSGSGVRRGSAVPLRMSASRDKQIYTIKPHGLEEASSAADYLKLGSAVVVSLDDVDRTTAVRIIDFMSGVCYGLDAQGHAMKLGDTIFLFTPGDFDITSDEPDYNENTEFFFRDVPTALGASSAEPAPAAERPVDRVSAEASPAERAPAARPWER